MMSTDDALFLNPWVITWCKAFPLLSLPSLDLFLSDDCSQHHREQRDETTKGDVSCSSSVCGQDPLEISTTILRESLSLIVFRSLFSNIAHVRPHRSSSSSCQSTENENIQNHICCLNENKNLQYGEILPETIIEIIALISQQRHHPAPLIRGGKVVDLGSGNGSTLFATALIHPFDVAVGIEIVPQRHKEALRHLSVWNSQHQQDTNITTTFQQKQTSFIFLLDDFSTHHLSRVADANLVIVHATAFEDDLMTCVERLCEECAPGTWFIMVSKPLGCWSATTSQAKSADNSSSSSSSSAFETWKVLDNGQMDWGIGTVFIQRRL